MRIQQLSGVVTFTKKNRKGEPLRFINFQLKQILLEVGVEAAENSVGFKTFFVMAGKAC
jgi:hypothetical protein